MAKQKRPKRATAHSEDSDDPSAPVKVAIIGGGCAGMAAAWHLSKLPRYEVTVFERSWRLGGKGASGRDEQGRIHEHGLHVWLGFYENAFKMIRECYAEVEARDWGPGSKEADGKLAHARFEDAFVPEPNIGVTGTNAAGQQTVWSGFLPPAKGLPGDRLDSDTNPFTLANYLLRCVELLKALMLSVIGTTAENIPGRPRPETRSTIDEAIDRESGFDPSKSPDLLVERIATRLRDGSLTAAAAVLQATRIVENALEELTHAPQVVGSALNFLTAVARQVRKQLTDVVEIDERIRWKAEIIEIVMTIAVGLYRDRVLLSADGLDAINDLDYRDWLRKHGATEGALNSRFITGIYDLVFAYEGGDRNKPRLAAGVALRGALRMFFTYRGAMFWRMRSGMGDAVFAPLYKVMSSKASDRRRQVKFHFLHRLERIDMAATSDGEWFVQHLAFAAPAHSENVPDSPVLDAFGGWPDANPFTDGALGNISFTVGKDFDAVVFAMGRDEFLRLCVWPESSDSKIRLPQAWQALVKERERRGRKPAQTVATGAAQVWLTSDLEQLGWYRDSAIISALGLSFDTWADMTHTLSTEHAWREANGQGMTEADRARSVAYFCGVLKDEEAKNSEDADGVLKSKLHQMLERELRQLWPRAFDDDRNAESLVLGGHTQANIEGSDRYSLSLPGTIRTRVSPLDRVVLNMTVAGDWTACGLDAGCVEAAVMSGMLAVHAIAGDKLPLESIVGYDHP